MQKPKPEKKIEEIDEILLNDLLNDFEIHSGLDDSVKNLSNWFLGISVGVFTVVLVNANDICGMYFHIINNKCLIFNILTIFNIFLLGFIKYLLIQRDLKKSKFVSIMKSRKMLGLLEISNTELTLGFWETEIRKPSNFEFIRALLTNPREYTNSIIVKNWALLNKSIVFIYVLLRFTIFPFMLFLLFFVILSIMKFL